ncbi:hypothetical protein [Aquicella lusitana]|uniref:Uncharacterized protein n=1 Tax=Aquicella lusitana TaxID=254246 RepID=A0A370GWM9_9COXI|nr:hypothetical protein [Aquicella lusitana]RDI46994.1 hypothetical protein C8D86_104121 [Aquicella lusitana]VVC73883.1 hypothetical protein AQULUS_16370 [Aquicella lusitana]
MPGKEQMQKNQNQSSQKDPITLLIERNPCVMCRAMRVPICKGHAGSGSGGGGKEDNKSAKHTLNQKMDAAKQMSHISSLFLDGKNWVQLQWLDNALSFEKPEAFLSIQIDSKNGILTLQGKKGLTKAQEDELRQYFDKIKDQFNEFMKEFKDEFKAQGISVANFSVDIKNNTLTIKMLNPDRTPNLACFAAFIDYLADKNLLPSKNLLETTLKEALMGGKSASVEQEKKSAFHPTPFSKTPKPNGWVK